MKVNLKTQLKNHLGKPMFAQEWSVSEGKMIDVLSQPTLASEQICVALINQTKESSTPEDLYKQYALFRKVDTAKGEVDLSSDEIVLIKKCLAKTGLPLVFGQCADILEGKK